MKLALLQSLAAALAPRFDRTYEGLKQVGGSLRSEGLGSRSFDRTYEGLKLPPFTSFLGFLLSFDRTYEGLKLAA